MRFAKGHGTGNDFVILPDLDDELKLTPALVSALCDRHTGIGADGVLRVALGDGVPWFMDYLNADGSVAEMCGNGIRVFARYLTDHKLATGPDLAIGTRSGVRQVRWDGDELFRVDMGPAVIVAEGDVDPRWLRAVDPGLSAAAGLGDAESDRDDGPAGGGAE